MSTSIYTPSLNDEIFSYPKPNIEYDDSDSTPANWNSGENNPMFGVKSPQKGKFGKDNPKYGTKNSAESKARMSAAAKKRCANMTVAERQAMTAKGRATRLNKKKELCVQSSNV